MKFRAAKADDNQPEIVEALRKAGATVKHVHQVKNLFDLIVAFKWKTYLVEIKDGAKFPKKFWEMSEPKRTEWIISTLTEGELKCKKDFEIVGVKIHIIYDVDSALKMIYFKSEKDIEKSKLLIRNLRIMNEEKNNDSKTNKSS